MANNYSTHILLRKMESGESIPDEEICFDGSLKEEKGQISSDIDKKFKSRNEFCNEACITPAHLSQFFSNKKNMGRNSLLRMFITLQYDIKTVQTLLTKFNAPVLYPRSRRDYIIIQGIIEKKTLDDIDRQLEDERYERICDIAD